MLQLVRNIYGGTIKPKNIETAIYSKPGNKIILLLKIFFVKIILSYSLVFFLSFFKNFENNTVQSIEEDFGLQLSFLIVVIIVPIYEEIIFRLPLVYRPINLALSVFGLCYFFLSSFIFGSNFLTLDINLFYKLVFSLVVALSVYFGGKRFSRLGSFWNGNFQVIYYSSILLFGFAHILNFKINFENYYLLPLVISPHLLAGIILNYIRIKLGFLFCCLFHIFNNLFVFILTI
ncbi:hypothetical protein BUL40_00760 [Croceivirga radicis]|uniref:CPBP family intramembrane metalloprotease n=1 Tax=Croceivirga radicis TaxID=1929488 RepID=A0A1V6LVP1_9FLAO|nr:CPBP family glutamic-type intramembrane protease [Croceivirga radicis]OQD44117.1 hypothetical protein BUL40_00760 [Croceivirga radicis]